MLLAQGGPLAETQREVDEALAYTKARFELVADAIRTDRQLIRMLRGLLPRFGSLTDADLDEETFEAHLRDPRMAITACWYWIRKLQARFHGNDFAAAVAAAENAAPLLWTSIEFFETAEYHFYAALAHAARHDEVAPEDRARHRDALVAHARRLGEWARQCPDNFRSRAALADAEIARIEGRVADAERLYESALTSARASGFAHDEAIAYEMAARFWRARGYPLFGDAYLQEACALLPALGRRGEGAAAHPPVPRPRQAADVLSSPISLAELPATSPDQLDLLAVIKASQTISGAMGREELVRTLLQIVIEQGGARRARLVRVRDGELEIAAEQTLAPEKDAGETAEPAEPAARAAAGRVPTSILHYVARTRERVVLDDAAADAGRFASDPYLAGARPRSVLCLPIRREGRVVALLYLENELAPGVFTPDRLVALELIAAQVAISLENALLLERRARRPRGGRGRQPAGAHPGRSDGAGVVDVRLQRRLPCAHPPLRARALRLGGHRHRRPRPHRSYRGGAPGSGERTADARAVAALHPALRRPLTGDARHRGRHPDPPSRCRARRRPPPLRG